MKDDDPKLAVSELGTLTAKKITWAMAGLVTDPGRYMFKFGWLTITADDLAIWQAYPNAGFTLIRTLTSPPRETDEESVGEEFRLGTFDLRIEWTFSTGEK
jgi:hypothetical protein